MKKDDQSEAEGGAQKQKKENDKDSDLKQKLKKAAEEAFLRDKKEKMKHENSEENSEIKKVKKELEEMTEMAKRTMADLQNMRRRQEEERKIRITMANADLIIKILPVLDNLERAKEHVPKGAEEWFKGIEMSINKLHQTLREYGLKPMETVGQKFNPDLHEAITEGPGEKDTVIEELEKGYILGERVIRHAKVKVGRT